MENGDNVMCILCQRPEENNITGALSSKGEVTAHQNCLVYSSGLFCRDSPHFDDLFGFSAEDVLSERQRGLKVVASVRKKVPLWGVKSKAARNLIIIHVLFKPKPGPLRTKSTAGLAMTVLDHLSDDDLPSTSTHNSKRKFDFNDRQGEKNALKRSRRNIPNESTDSDATDTGEQTDMLAPIESDIEENDDELLNGNLPTIAPGTDHQEEIQGSTENAVSTPLHSDTNISMDSSQFWSHCNASGCAQAIFEDFIKEMTDIFTRITSRQASKQDDDVAFNIMMASGKLRELVAKQQKDLQKQLAELQQAATTLNKVATKLS